MSVPSVEIAGLAGSVQQLWAGVQSRSWVDASLGAVGTSLDGLSLAFDPIGAILSWGVETLIDVLVAHFKPVADLFNAIFGDPAAITAAAQTWTRAAAALREGRADLDHGVRQLLGQWRGAPADAAGKRLSQHRELAEIAAKICETTGALVVAGGAVVAVARRIAIGMIAEFVAQGVKWLGTAVISGGTLAPGVVASIVEAIRRLFGRISRVVGALKTSLQNLRGHANQLQLTTAQFRQKLQELTPAPPAAGPKDRPRDTHRAADAAWSRPVKVERFGATANQTYLVTFEDGSRGLYKPRAGDEADTRARNEPRMRRTISPFTLAEREVAAYLIDRRLGFNEVPRTVMWNGPHGPGSLQAWVDGATAALPALEYPLTSQQRMAIRDYVFGNTDRYMGNYLTKNGAAVPIDHGYSSPEVTYDGIPARTNDRIRSDFVVQWLDRPLDPDLVARVRAVDLDELERELRAAGLKPAAVAGDLARLAEIQREGRITGAAWPGDITDQYWRSVPRGR